jgi:hypothetical protein
MIFLPTQKFTQCDVFGIFGDKILANRNMQWLIVACSTLKDSTKYFVWFGKYEGGKQADIP